MPYEFKKISNNHDRLRDDVIVCEHCSPIMKGESVVLHAKAKDTLIGEMGGFRMIQTSMVVDIDFPHPAVTRITTESGSVYEIRQI